MSLGLFGCANTNTITDPISFSDLANVEFMFTSGAGAWRTVLRIDEEGKFVGEFSDAEMGAGEYYLSNFSGQFKNPEADNRLARCEEHIEYHGNSKQKSNRLHTSYNKSKWHLGQPDHCCQCSRS